MVIKQKTYSFDIAVITVLLVAAVLAWSFSRSYALVEQASGSISINQAFNRTKPVTTTESSLPTTSEVQQMQIDNIYQQLEDAMSQFVASQPNNYSISLKHLASGTRISANEDEVMTAASIYKVFAAMAALRLVDAGQANLNEVLARGEGKTLEECIRAAISVSDNPCGHALLARANLSSPNGLKVLHDLGYKHTDMRGDYPVSSASDVAKLFEDIYAQQLLQPKSNQLLLSALKNQKVNDRLPAGLPAGAVIAHKTGDLEGAIHDAGIVYGDQGDYIIVIMSQRGDDQSQLRPGQRYERMAAFTSRINNIMSNFPLIDASE